VDALPAACADCPARLEGAVWWRLPAGEAACDCLAVASDKAFLQQVTRWARHEDGVGALLLVGSPARAEVPADEWSDIDLLLVVDDPRPYVDDAGWLQTFGAPLLTFVEPTAVGPYEERRVLFEEGPEVDFAVLPTAGIDDVANDPETLAVLRRGYRLLVDRIALAPLLSGAQAQPGAVARSTPGQAEFDQLTHDFWYHQLLAAKKLRRGEVWVAKQVCDCHCKALLVQLFASGALGRDPSLDTWHQGRFLERWAPPTEVEQLRGSFAQYTSADVARALQANADLFTAAEQECTRVLDVTSTTPHETIRGRLQALLQCD
jgi:aminoglycoside 6-adenylyltransferase